MGGETHGEKIHRPKSVVFLITELFIFIYGTKRNLQNRQLPTTHIRHSGARSSWEI